LTEPEVLIYTTNAIESLNSVIRKADTKLETRTEQIYDRI
jgi:transposase-like protein